MGLPSQEVHHSAVSQDGVPKGVQIHQRRGQQPRGVTLLPITEAGGRDGGSAWVQSGSLGTLTAKRFIGGQVLSLIPVQNHTPGSQFLQSSSITELFIASVTFVWLVSSVDEHVSSQISSLIE